MSVIDKIVAEWAFRCKKGYPDMNNPDDMKILKEIYSEFGITVEATTDKKSLYDYNKEYIPVAISGKENTRFYVKQNDFDDKTKQVKPGAKYYLLEPKGKGRGQYQNIYKEVDPFAKEPKQEPEQKSKTKHNQTIDPEEVVMVTQQLKNAGVPDNLIEQTIGTAAKPNPNFRAIAGVEEYVSSDNVKKSIENFGYLYKYQILRGGKGELIPFVAIRGAKLGGPNEKDIVDKGGRVLEVKELPGKGSKREFALASGASVAGSTFVKHLETFLKAIEPYNDLPYFRGIDKLTSLDSVNSGYLADLQQVISNFPYTEKDLSEDTEEVKIKGVKYSIKKGVQYILELDDEGNLKPNKNAPIQAKVADVNMRKLLNHPWIVARGEKGGDAPMKDLEKVRQGYLESIDYLMLWTSESNAVIVDAKNTEQVSKIGINRVATGNLSLTYFVDK